jgi:hypothetical protein
MDPVLSYHRPEAPPPLVLRLWHLAKPLVIGAPLVVLLGVGMGMLVYGLGMPSDAPPPPPESINNYSYYNAWDSARREQRDRASVMGIGAGLLTAGLTTAVLYLIRFLSQSQGAFTAGPPPSPPAAGSPQRWPTPPPTVPS